MNFEKKFNQLKETTSTKLKVGIAALLMASPIGMKAQQIEIPKNISEKIINVIDTEKDIHDMKSRDVYEFYNPAKILEEVPEEEFQKIKHKMSDEPEEGKTPLIHSPLLQKIREIEEKSGILKSKPLFPSDFNSKEEFIKNFKEERLNYQKKVGKEVEEFKNKYFKGKYEFYLKTISKIKKGEFQGGYLIRDDLFINSFMNFYYSKERALDYEEALLNYIENYQEDENWRRYDYDQSEEDIERQAEELWDLDQQIQRDQNKKTEEQDPNAKPSDLIV